MSRLNADVVIALLLLVFSTVLFVDTFSYQRMHLTIIGAKLWPRIVLVALFILSFVYLVQALRAPKTTSAPFDLAAWLRTNRNVIACFVLYALFLATLPYLGMLLGGTLFLFATLAVLGRRDPKSHLVHFVIAVAAMGSMWSIFTFGLGVILPEGVILPR
jgi:hypothetical protein